MSKISDAILKVSFSVGKIEKNGKNQHFNFKYQAWDDVLPEVRNACIAHDLTIIPSVVSVTHVKTAWDSDSKPNEKVIVLVNFTLLKDEESLTFQFAGEALNNDDKSIQKAITSATKYFFLKTFMIPCQGDTDPDGDHGTAEIAKVKANQEEKPREPKQETHLAIAKAWNITDKETSDLKSYCQSNSLKPQEIILEAHYAGAKNLKELYEYIEQTGKFAEAS